VSTTRSTRAARRVTPFIALAGAGALALTSCAGGGGSDDSSFSYLGQTQNTAIAGNLEDLGAGACATAEEASPLSTDSVDGTQWDQQMQLLAGQSGLSDISMAAGTPALMNEFIDAGQVVDLSAALEDLGVADRVLPAADSLIKSLYGRDALYALPTELNIEGFWYNEQLLADNGVEPPATWDELVDAAATLDAAGVQPFVASGQDGWPVTRLIGNYIARDLGADALRAVADGDASLTDPEYVAAAQAVSDLGSAGYFGPAAGSIDGPTAENQFLTGGGAFYYMGSWALAAFNDEELNQIGADNIGYLPFPEVEGGAGSVMDVPANVGIPVMLSQAGYDESSEAWLQCIAENYGDVALEERGQVTGFVTESDVEVPELTATVQQTIAEAGTGLLWFEAFFTPEATTVSQTNGGSLATGQISGQEFMELVEAANG